MMRASAPLSPRPSPLSATELRDAFTTLKDTRRLRSREAAHALGVSEGAALAAFVGERVVRLDGRFAELFETLPQLGRVLALTRNEAAVHEKEGMYGQMSHDGDIGLALGAIDLRIFYQHWAAAFAVLDGSPWGPLKSLQIFDAQGHAIHKVFLREHSDHPAFERFVEHWRAPEQTPGWKVAPAASRAPKRLDADVDVTGLCAAWDAMTDVHQFSPILARFGVSRIQAFRLAGASRARPVGTGALRRVLLQASASGLPIMVFVGNHGMIQIHTGPVKRIIDMGPWLNVLDPGFDLHLREDLIASAWAISKPTSDGIITSLELFDAHDDVIAMLFGARWPGRPERAEWRELVASLDGTPAQTEATRATTDAGGNGGHDGEGGDGKGGDCGDSGAVVASAKAEVKPEAGTVS